MRDLFTPNGKVAGRYSTWHTFMDTLAILLGIIALGVIVATATIMIWAQK